jgi:MoxR-like ATPase
MATQITTLDHIMRIPLPVVESAYMNNVGLVGNRSKRDIAQELAARVDAGLITLDQIRQYKPNTVAPAQPATQPAAPDVDGKLRQMKDRIIDAVGIDLNRIGNQVDTLSVAVSRIDSGVDAAVKGLDSIRSDTAAKLDDLEKRLTRAQQNAGSVKLDQGEIAAAVAAAVASEFGTFKRAVEDAGLQQVAADLSAVHVTGTDAAYNVFDCPAPDAAGTDMPVQLWNSPAAPAVDPNFIWRGMVLRHLILSEQTGENVWFGGEKGAGKTQTAQQFAARTGRGFCRINFHKYTTAEEYIGSTALVGGNTVFAEGDFLRAYETPGTVILLDEITNAAPGELAPLNALLEPGAAVTIGGKVRRRAPGVMIIAADNTLTNGDQSGRYSGTQQMNSALADRFSRVVPFKHLDFYHEVAAVQRHTGCTEDLAKAVIEMVNVCRQQVDAGNIVDAPSIRQIVAFIRALPVLGADEAFDTCIAARQPGESEIAINAIKAAHLNNNIFKV